MGRLEWLLDGLAGRADWGADADEVLAPAFTARVATETFMTRVRSRALTYAPLTVLGLEVSGDTARARIRRYAGTANNSSTDSAVVSTADTVDVVTCIVEADAPHRIVSAYTTGLVPDHVTPRLPMDFSEYPLAPLVAPLPPPRTSGAELIVFSGVPGVGKSTLADAVGSRLGIPVFATDWLLGALTPFGGRHLDGLMGMGSELLTTLALRQLALGQSAILDHPSESLVDRERWRSLARSAGAHFVAVYCECSDPAVHRARLEGRTRAIPGWHDAGVWSNVQARLTAFPPWPEDALTIDTVGSLAENVAAVLARVE